MRDVRVPWVRPGQLGDYRRNRLGDGGQGVVYGVPRPPDRLPGTYLAFKEYKVPIDADVLHDMCCFLDLLSDEDRAFLEPRLTWPVAMVYTGSPPNAPPPSANPATTVVGFLMNRVTGEFELSSPTLGQTKPQALEFLLNGDDYMSMIGLHADDGQRLRLLIDLAHTLDRLHRQHVTVGDLSPKNVMFTLAGQGRCLLIDCDSMRYRGRDVLTQVETTGWEVPEGEKGTVASDSFKFGLIALRLFNRSQDLMDPGPLRGVSPDLADLAMRSQSREPHRRPRPADWLSALDRADSRLKTRRSTAGTGPGINGTVTVAPHQQVTGTGSAAVPPQPPVPGPAGGSPGGGRAAGTLVVLLVMAVLGYGAVNHFDSSNGSDDSPSPVSSGSPYGGSTSDSGPGFGSQETEDSGSARAEAPGAAVDYSQVAGDPEAEEVAAMFARFFGAINTRDYDTALSYYDPATTAVDMDSTVSRNKWKQVMSTTKDSRLVLSGLDTSGKYTFATVHFRSRQSPGYGPAERPNDTCDDWTVTYQLTRTDGFRIFKAPRDGVSYAPC
ncbi:hypothetical protein [Streptomyces azureus]|uniref:Protein kinase domain-containing protein n=1 Tax=Streptomyces azureus TaxID=146537 RepID=A0A0K8PWV1_STRAJ|nr:hypothetical protein [Streptomyces azureus]GAP51899.1 uncharacterized protein SAZU_6772 [Streptomyces azureus]